MFTPGNLKALLLISASLLSTHAHVGAQTKGYEAFKGRFALDGDQESELQAALNPGPAGFRVRALFDHHGPYVILERRADARASPVETSGR